VTLKYVVQIGTYMHSVEGTDLLFKVTEEGKVPRFNSFIYKQNKAKIGKIDEILGAVDDVMFSAKPAAGVAMDSLKEGETAWMAPNEINTCHSFLAPPPSRGRGGRGGRGGGGRGAAPRGGGGRGNFGGNRGGNFGNRGSFGGQRGSAPRGGGSFSSRGGGGRGWK
jgi:H/ACA ribonucleoprotein complex subunit 1